MQTIRLTCASCGSKFDRPLKEFTYKSKKGKTKFYCGLRCSAKSNKALIANSGKFYERIKGFKRKPDEFSPFRYYVRQSRSAARIKDYGCPDITVEYLKRLWENQQGICPYTQKVMQLPRSTQASDIKGTPNRASLDRIDSSRGYVQGNVEFVCLAVNYAKNGFSREEMINFFSKRS